MDEKIIRLDDIELKNMNFINIKSLFDKRYRY